MATMAWILFEWNSYWSLPFFRPHRSPYITVLGSPLKVGRTMLNNAVVVIPPFGRLTAYFARIHYLRVVLRRLVCHSLRSAVVIGCFSPMQKSLTAYRTLWWIDRLVNYPRGIDSNRSDFHALHKINVTCFDGQLNKEVTWSRGESGLPFIVNFLIITRRFANLNFKRRNNYRITITIIIR